MTNFESLKGATLEEYTNAITLIAVELLAQVYPVTEDIIKKERQYILNWLKQEVVSGDYLN